MLYVNMAAPCTAIMRLRALCNLGQTFERSHKLGANWALASQYGTKAGAAHGPGGERSEKCRGNVDLLREFPEPKNLLHATLSKSLGLTDLSQHIQYNCTDGEVKRATVTLLWPQKIEVEGFASRRVNAERFAAAAACHRLRELGVIGSDNQLPRRGKRSATYTSMWKEAEEDHVDHGDAAQEQRSMVSSTAPARSWPEEDIAVSEAMSMFKKPKLLLSTVLQLATSTNRVRELAQYRTVGGKLKSCLLTLRWPEEMTFTATGRKRLVAETRAAALACMRLKELRLLDDNNNALTHAQYHKEEVREAGERERRPCRLEIPEDLQDRVQKYLAEYPVKEEMQKLWEEVEEQEARQQQLTDQEENDDDITDAITGRPYRPLQPEEAEQLSDSLLYQWKSAGPNLGTKLPVDAHRDSLVAEVESSRVVVVAGETGCGKTTRVPRFLLEGRVRAGEGAHCNILVTQPRRISAVSVAQRVAQEMGPGLRRSVGYQVRLESRPPEQSGGALLFLTTGVLLRKLRSNGALRGVSHVVVDEVHERDVHTDLLLALLRSALSENPHLRLVLMSATGDAQRLSRYFSRGGLGRCPVVHVPGFMHPVRQSFLEEVEREMGGRRRTQREQQGRRAGRLGDKGNATPDTDLVADVINHVHTHGEPGAVLCFLPGWQDIKAVQQKLEEMDAFRSGAQVIKPLHSSMAVAEQQGVFQRPPKGQRKIVLATNIAETSITIDDIVHVIDTGAHKEQSYDPRTKVSCLDTVWVSQSNVTQRKGRAGRCQPGHAYHLFPREQLEAMTTYPIPEILRTPLESLVLQAKIHCPESKAEEFLSQVLDPPERHAIREAVKNLQDIGVLDGNESLTSLGERVAVMSCDPQLGKLLVLSAMFRCVLPVLYMVACLTRDPFLNSMQNRSLIAKSKQMLSGNSHSDYLVYSRVMRGWRNQQGWQSRQEYLDTYTLSGAGLRFIEGLTLQFSDNLSEAQMVQHANECLRGSALCNQFSGQEQLLKAVLMAGLYPNLIQVKKGVVTKTGRFRRDSLSYRTQNSNVVLHRSTVNSLLKGKDKLPSRWLTFYGAVKSEGQVFIRDSSTVHPLALLLLTDSDLTETVYGDQVEVAMLERSSIRWELPENTWKLLWELRTSLQTMLHRNLLSSSKGSVTAGDSAQDTKLISLLVDLLNNTEQQVNSDINSDDEFQFQQRDRSYKRNFHRQ